ncbi:hypothetical protein CLOM_g8956, partial [Closterium sp. NIES-68]
LSDTPTTLDVCGSGTSNPCAVGSCINDGSGSYTCICPPTHTAATTSNGLPTCRFTIETGMNWTLASTLVVQADNWSCEDVYLP